MKTIIEIIGAVSIVAFVFMVTLAANPSIPREKNPPHLREKITHRIPPVVTVWK